MPTFEADLENDLPVLLEPAIYKAEISGCNAIVDKNGNDCLVWQFTLVDEQDNTGFTLPYPIDLFNKEKNADGSPNKVSAKRGNGRMRAFFDTIGAQSCYLGQGGRFVTERALHARARIKVSKGFDKSGAPVNRVDEVMPFDQTTV